MTANDFLLSTLPLTQLGLLILIMNLQRRVKCLEGEAKK